METSETTSSHYDLCEYIDCIIWLMLKRTRSIHDSYRHHRAEKFHQLHVNLISAEQDDLQ